MNLTFSFRKAISTATITFSICFLLLIGLGLLVLRHFNSLKNYNHQAVHAYTVISQIRQAESLLKDAESGTRAFLITKNSGFLQPIFNTNRLLMPALDSLGKLVYNNPMQKKDYESAVKLARQQLEISNLLISTSAGSNDNTDSSIDALMFRSRNIMNSYSAVTKHMINIETDNLIYRKKQIGYYQSKLVNNFTLLFATGMLIIMVLGTLAFIEFKKRILYQTSLEENIIALNQNNAELEQIAFAASHDLQEPLRKIRIFSDRLRIINKNKQADESALIVEKINHSAKQLHGLISDLVDLTNIIKSEKTFNHVALKDIIEKTELQFADEIKSCGCKIIKSDLPVVNGSEEYLERLFFNLFSNSFAFKFSERNLMIIISSQKIKDTAIKNLPKQSAYTEYDHIKFQDNGTGFNDAFLEKLFMPFQRLHNYGDDGMRRKGMGLAICKRIMVNHGGWIDAEGREGEGATIHLYFPVIVL